MTLESCWGQAYEYHMDTTNLKNEADVERKVVEPLLLQSQYLGFPEDSLRPKEFIAPFDIDKGDKKIKGYYPDYLIEIFGLPGVAIEAKKPNVSALEAFREAQLYCQVLNTNFNSKINPCQVAVGCNGEDLVVGKWDSTPTEYKISKLTVGSIALEEVRKLVSSAAIYNDLQEIRQILSNKTYLRPSSLGEGQSFLLSKIVPNEFAAEIAPALRAFFTSENQNHSRKIYEKAYVSSTENSGYDKAFDFYLKDRISKQADRTAIKPTKKNEPTLTGRIESFSTRRAVDGDLQIITGGVGAGKSLFIRRYKELLLPDELKSKIHWAFLDFNSVPPDTNKWENWVYTEVSRSLSEENYGFDLTNADDQERIFNQKIKEKQAHYSRLDAIEGQSGALQKALDIESWRIDPIICAQAMVRFLQGDKRHTVIIVFDNVDRRHPEEQLLAFQWAMNLKKNTRSLVLLQMRDDTFERFKDEKPLDTYKTGGAFHISPPRFVSVVRKRLELALEGLHDNITETQSLTTSGGMVLKFPATKAASFLSEIYSIIFERKSNIAKIIDALAGRNVRRSLDMFMSIITSGHIPASTMGSFALGGEIEKIPERIILRTLMRGDSKFTGDSSGFTANIFQTHQSWETPSNLTIPNILFYLIAKRKLTGDNGQMGYIAISRLTRLMSSCGFAEKATTEACNYILSYGLADADQYNDTGVNPVTCMKISSSGFAHMRLLSSRSEYLLGVLPITPVNDKDFANSIYDAMRIEMQYGEVTFMRRKKLLLDFQENILKQVEHHSQFPMFDKDGMSGSKYIHSQITRAIDLFKNHQASPREQNQLDLL